MEAAAALKGQLAKRPASDFVILRVGWLQYLAANYNDSIESYKKALNLNPKSLEARLGMALPLLAQKKGVRRHRW